MSVYVELEVKGRYALSVITDRWSEDEKQALMDGDPEALRAAVDAAVARALTAPTEVEVTHEAVYVSGVAARSQGDTE